MHSYLNVGPSSNGKLPGSSNFSGWDGTQHSSDANVSAPQPRNMAEFYDR